MEQLLKLKIVLGIEEDSQDELLDLLLEDARNYILAYTRRGSEQWLSDFDSVQRRIAVIDFNRRGAEGAARQKEGDISADYLGAADYPDSVVRRLNPYRMIR